MQRLLRIVLFITFMLLIILWFSTIFNTCNKKDDAETNTENEMTGASDTSDVFQDLDDEFFEDDKDLFTEDSDNTSSESTSPESTGNTAADIFDAEETENYTDYTGTETQSTPPANTGTYSDNANYLVVAGSFLVKENAVKMENKLSAMGYSAEVRNFNYSQYHSVIAGRFDSKSSADRVAAQLKTKGISCYVHKRQP